MNNERISKKKKKNKYLINSKQAGEALELLTSLENNSVDLVFLDPQYEKVSQVLKLDYPLFGLRQNIQVYFSPKWLPNYENNWAGRKNIKTEFFLSTLNQ